MYLYNLNDLRILPQILLRKTKTINRTIKVLTIRGVFKINGLGT